MRNEQDYKGLIPSTFFRTDCLFIKLQNSENIKGQSQLILIEFQKIKTMTKGKLKIHDSNYNRNRFGEVKLEITVLF